MVIALTVTTITLAVVAAMVLSFVYGNDGTRRFSVYVLVAVALVAPLLNGWLVLVLFFPEFTPSGLVVSLAQQVLFRWAIVAAALLIVWALAHWFIRIGKVPADTAASSGETHAS